MTREFTKMFQIKCISVFLATLFATLATGQDFGFGKCPEVTVQPDFDVAQYVGLWYENRRYPMIFQNGNCDTAQYSVSENGEYVDVVNSELGTDGKINQVIGTAKAVGPASLNVEFPGSPVLPGSNYRVLSTDYKNYSAVFACYDVTEFVHFNFGWILTRERFPSEDTVNNALAAFKQNGLSTSSMQITDQVNCDQLL